MKKVILLTFMLFSLKVFPLDIAVESGYLNGTNDGNYDGWYGEMIIPFYRFSDSFYLSANPFIHFVDKHWDPGIIINLNKEFSITSKWKFVIFGGIGGMYLSTDDTRQHENYNFKENIGAGFIRALTPSTEIYLRGSVWHISNGGITDGNSGINGNSVGLGIKHSF